MNDWERVDYEVRILTPRSLVKAGQWRYARQLRDLPPLRDISSLLEANRLLAEAKQAVMEGSK